MRINGVNISNDKKIDTALTYIFGIGAKTATEILKKANIYPSVRVKDLTSDEIALLQNIISNDYATEGTLRNQIKDNINRLKENDSYRGSRHKKNLPANGQRTHTNAKIARKG